MKYTIDMYFNDRNFQILTEENDILLEKTALLEHELNHLKIKYEQTITRMYLASIN